VVPLGKRNQLRPVSERRGHRLDVQLTPSFEAPEIAQGDLVDAATFNGGQLAPGDGTADRPFVDAQLRRGRAS
jgi:hypothetical protein